MKCITSGEFIFIRNDNEIEIITPVGNLFRTLDELIDSYLESSSNDAILLTRENGTVVRVSVETIKEVLSKSITEEMHQLVNNARFDTLISEFDDMRRKFGIVDEEEILLQHGWSYIDEERSGVRNADGDTCTGIAGTHSHQGIKSVMSNRQAATFPLPDGTILTLRDDGMCRIDGEGGRCDVHHDTIMNAVAQVEYYSGDKFLDDNIGPDRYSFFPSQEDDAQIAFFDESGESCKMPYNAIKEFAGERMVEYLNYLIDRIPPSDVFHVSRDILGILESSSLDDEDILNHEGWVIMRNEPFEIFHPETGSTATGAAAELVMISLRGELGGFLG